jgi:hypothetical protein
MTLEEMKKELNNLSKKELVDLCIAEFGGRYYDNLDLIKSKVEQTLKHIKDEERLKLDKKCEKAYAECEKAYKLMQTPKYLELSTKLEKLQSEPYTKTCYKDILDHNKKINKVIDAMQYFKQPYIIAKRKYLELCRRSEELYKNDINI